MTMATRRCFLAVPVCGALADRCLALAKGKGRAVPRENLHLTLQFLGEVNDQQRIALLPLLQQLASEHAPFMVALGQARAFPSVSGPLYVLELVPSPALQGLHQRLQAGLVAQGFSADPRPWRPHITLARPGRCDPADSAQAVAGSLPVAEIVLYQSVARPSAPPAYLALQKVPLTG